MHTSPIAAKLKLSGKLLILVDESSPINHNINSVINQVTKRLLILPFRFM